MPKKLEFKPGDRFGRLTVLSSDQRLPGKKEWYSYCVCDCGNTCFVRNAYLSCGHTKSCGCITRRYKKADSDTECPSSSRLYVIWSGMKQRCNSPNAISYHNYGGRGIKICDEWQNSFEAFREWALANGYEDGLTIDRIDNDGNYCPENCEWVTHKENCNHTRQTHYITHNGKTQTVTQWADELGISPMIIFNRLRYGWSIEETLTRPVKDGYRVKGRRQAKLAAT